MKRKLFILIPALVLVIFAASCKKDDPTPSPTTVEGTWMGTGQYGTTPGNPTYAFTLTFKSGGNLNIIGNNNSGPDTGTGTWQLVQDSVQAVFSYSAGSAIYRLSGKFSTNSNVMTGTIGLGSSTTGIGLFSVTKQ